MCASWRQTGNDSNPNLAEKEQEKRVSQGGMRAMSSGKKVFQLKGESPTRFISTYAPRLCYKQEPVITIMLGLDLPAILRSDTTEIPLTVSAVRQVDLRDLCQLAK